MLNSRSIEKLFRATLIVFIVFMVVCFIADEKVSAATPKDPVKHYYSTLLKVYSVEWDRELKTGRVFFIDCYNRFYGMGIQDGDIYPGEFYTAIMYNNATSITSDDIIVKIKYCRIDLF